MDAPYAQDRGSTWFNVLGRLKAGITVGEARADLARVQSNLGRQFPKTDANLSVSLRPLKEDTISGVRRSLWVLFGSVTLLLVIACTNVAALLLARTAGREREISVRFSLGASRAAVIAQLLMECFLLAGELAHASRSQVSTRNPLQWVLVGIQVAFAVTLLCGAGLLLRSFRELGRVSPGFEPTNILTLRISANWGETADMKKLTQHIDHMQDAIRAVPGVVAAATAGDLPGVPADNRTELRLVEGRAESEGKIIAQSRFVSANYFATMEIPLLEGQGCRASDNYFSTIVVNRSFANAYFGDSPAIGHHLKLVSSQFLPTPMEIRGIAGDAREQGLSHEPSPTVYWCVSAPYPTPYFLIRTRGEPLAMAEILRRRIHKIAPSRSVFDVASLEQRLFDSFEENRLRTVLLTLFAVTAVLLVSVGLYGTLSYFVAMRRREVALRLALGAVRARVAAQFVIKGVAVAMTGCVAGLLLAATLARGLAGMLYGVSPLDIGTFISVPFLILAVAALASLLPAVRASHVEPMDVLRDE